MLSEANPTTTAVHQDSGKTEFKCSSGENEAIFAAQVPVKSPITSLNSSAPTQPKPCSCKRKGRSHNCAMCTMYYPVSVMRSRDGEYDALNYLIKYKNIQKSLVATNTHAPVTRSVVEENDDATQNASNVHRKTVPSSDSSSSSSADSSDVGYYDQMPPVTIQLKPSPIPISANLVSLLVLSSQQHTTTFVPPPNKSLAIFRNQTPNSSNTKFA